jgi:hypothetical protein
MLDFPALEAVSTALGERTAEVVSNAALGIINAD